MFDLASFPNMGVFRRKRTTFLAILGDQKALLAKCALAGSFVLALLDPSFEPNDVDLCVSGTGEENKELIVAFAKALGVEETDIFISGTEENEIASFVYEGMPRVTSLFTYYKRLKAMIQKT